ACGDLSNNNFSAFGNRMYASHKGLRDEYEVSCRELDILVEGASGISGVYGARMMGAGFGGCTINLVEENRISHFQEQMNSVYRDRLNREPKFYITSIKKGTSQLNKNVEEIG
ncbi:MAG: galactokinase, partial [Calditrichia bacterium]